MSEPASIPGRELDGITPTGAEPQGPVPVLHLQKPRRMVFDTNVLVSLYVFSDSRFLPLRKRIECGDWHALTNDACLGEFRRVLAYPMFALDAPRQEDALAAYVARARPIAAPAADTTMEELPRCKDRDDQKFLELARDGMAECLITADKALLKLARRERLRGIFRIITPDAALSER